MTTDRPSVAVPGARTIPTRGIAWTVALLALFAHLGLWAGGVWDFELLNYDDPQVVALARDTSVGEVLRGPVWYAYKPVYILSLKIDTVFADVPAGLAHVHNLLLHVLATLLLLVLLTDVLRSRWMAAAAAVLFAVHPVHVESIAWVASRKDLLSLVFVLLAHLLYRRARRGGSVSWAAPLLLLLGGLSKGTVWVWVGVLAIDELIERARALSAGLPYAWTSALLRLTPAFVVCVGGVVLDAWMASAHGPGAVEHGVGVASLAAAMGAVYARYLGHLVAPLGLSIDYGVDPAGSWGAPLAWVGVLLLAAAIALLVVALRRRWPTGIFAAGLWLVGLVPFNNLWPRTSVLMADRYLYVPAIGVYVLVAFLLARRPWSRVLVLPVVAVALLALSVHRTTQFRDSASVWANATEAAPHSALAWIQYGHAVALEGEWRRARTYADRAIDLDPRPELLVRARLLRTNSLIGEMGAQSALGRRVQDGDLRDALAEANRARELAGALETLPIVKGDPRELRSEAEVLRGKLLELLRDPAAALVAYEAAARIWEDNATAHYDYATLLARAQTAEALRRAEAHLRRALRVRPAFLEATLQLVTVLARQQRPDDALKELESAEERHGRIPELLYARAGVYLEVKHDVSQAEALLQEIERIEPDHPDASKLLGEIQIARGRLLMKGGRAKRDRKKLRAAIERFDAAARVRERWWEPEVWAGDAWILLANYREARKRYRNALELSADLAWVERLLARAIVLEAASTARHAEDDVERAEAARLMAAAVVRPVRAIEFGNVPFHEELEYLRAVAKLYEAGSTDMESAGRVLRAAALAVTGDGDGARRQLAGVFRTLSPDTEHSDVLDAALLLRGLLRGRRVGNEAERELARRDYRFLVERRPDDPLPRLRLLEQDFHAARARLSIARGHTDDPERIAEALAGLEDSTAAIAAIAVDHPDLMSAGLIAAEAEMERQNWIGALRRLNAMRDRFPRDPRVWRGQAAVYVAQYSATRERSLLAEAARALGIARMLDPREPNTLLDASQVAWFASRREEAKRYAEEALTYEMVDGGPAAQRLSGLHVAEGRLALESGDGQRALAAAREAQRADPGAAAPWILQGDLFLKARRRDEAYWAYLKAKELEPLSEAATHGLAEIHGERALVYSLQGLKLTTPPHPRTADPEGWEALSEEERAEKLKAWQERVRRVEEARDENRRRQMRELEAAVRLDPDGEETRERERLLADLRGRDPEARHKAALAAEEHFLTGRDLYGQKELLEALREFRKATDLFPGHSRASVWAAMTAYALLSRPRGESEEEAQYERKFWILAMEQLHLVDSQGGLASYPDRHRARGLLHEWRWRRWNEPDDQIAASRALQRYVRAMVERDQGDDDTVRDARGRLRRLESGED